MFAKAFSRRLLYVSLLAGVGFLLPVGQASALPNVISFTASTNALPWTGGSVVLSATVGGSASSCKFTATPAGVSGLATVACSASNSASLTVSVPANTKSTAKTYTFNLVVKGGGTANGTAVTVTVAPEPDPSITSLDVTPAFLPASGGTVSLSVTGVSDATTCKFNSTPKVAPLPVNLPCTSGSASTSVTVLANTKKPSKPYTFTVTATRNGATAATLQKDVVVAGSSARTDLAVSQTDSSDPVPLGNYVTYTLTVQNNGPDPATGVTVSDTLPAGAAYAGAFASQGDCTPTGSTVSCSLGVLTAGTSASVYVTVQATASGTVSNAATVAGDETDLVAANNSSAEQTLFYEPIAVTGGPAEGSTVRDNGALFQFTLNGASTATCQLDNFPSSSCTSSFSTANSRYSSSSATLGNNLGSGSHTVRISASGSFGFYQVVRHFTVPLQPLLTSNPATGTAFGQFTNYNVLSGLYPTGFSNYLASEVVNEAVDGSMLVLGSYNKRLFNPSSSITDERGFVLMKVKPDLTLDPSFGTGGVVEVQAPGQASFQSPELITAADGNVYTVTIWPEL